MKASIIFGVLLTCSLLDVSTAFSAATFGNCATLFQDQLPVHGVTPQTGAPPYTVTSSATSYTPGSNEAITG